MNSDELFRFYERLYFYELEVREKINSRINIPLAIIISLFGFLGYQINNILTQYFSFWIKISGIIIAIALLTLIIGMYYIIRSWHGHEYKCLPYATDIENYKTDLLDYYRNEGEYDNNFLAMNDIREDIYDYYVRHSSMNALTNDKKAAFLYKSINCIIITTFLSFASYTIFTLSKLQ